jgi:protein tyrosine phosphatase (PTP) superfamily phosphohydrolase (DUF442 family)
MSGARAMKQLSTLILAGAALALVLAYASEPALEKPVAIPSDSIENFYRASSRVYSGSSPHGKEAFEELKRIGVKTIISVDGARPDLDAASRAGLRYIHIPIGYDRVGREAQLQLIQAVKTVEGPVFIHCHHGKHRGPAAAAIICQGVEGWGADRAVRWLQQAGTASDYAGLYQSAETFQTPRAEELAAIGTEFPTYAPVSGMVNAMVELDARWERLKWVQKAGYGPVPSHPDIDPAHEALLLAELYRELLRDEESRAHGPDFMERLRQSEAEAQAMRHFLKEGTATTPERLEQGATLWRAAGHSCAACHKSYRN